MTYRTRIKYTAEQKAEMWDRWPRGESLNSIGPAFDRPSSSIFSQLAPSGGIRPPIRQRSGLALTLAQREEISRGIASNLSLPSIATQLGRSPPLLAVKSNAMEVMIAIQRHPPIKPLGIGHSVPNGAN